MHVAFQSSSSILCATFVGTMLLGAIPTHVAANEKDKAMTPDRAQQLVDLLKNIETGDPKPVAYVNASKYIPHVWTLPYCQALLLSLG
jgi:hypothetical protein